MSNLNRQPAYNKLKSVQELADEAYDSINTLPLNKVGKAISHYSRVFRKAVEDSQDIAGMSNSDVQDIAILADDLSEIGSRTLPDDIRSWQSRGVQKSDALTSIQKYMTVSSKSVKRWQGMSDKKRAKTTLHGVPNYKFSTGETVKVGSSKNSKYGKVLEIGVETNTGKQYYKVRVNGMDAPKIYYRNELYKTDK